jgi:hypothetical protein
MSRPMVVAAVSGTTHPYPRPGPPSNALAQPAGQPTSYQLVGQPVWPSGSCFTHSVPRHSGDQCRNVGQIFRSIGQIRSDRASDHEWSLQRTNRRCIGKIVACGDLHIPLSPHLHIPISAFPHGFLPDIFIHPVLNSPYLLACPPVDLSLRGLIDLSTCEGAIEAWGEACTSAVEEWRSERAGGARGESGSGGRREGAQCMKPLTNQC